jgi:outer membrane receptor for monomeric catechols
MQADAFLYYSGKALAGGSKVVPSYVRIDARLGWHVQPNWELSLVGQNLAQRRHLEFVQELLDIPTYVERGFYVKSVWRF